MMILPSFLGFTGIIILSIIIDWGGMARIKHTLKKRKGIELVSHEMDRYRARLDLIYSDGSRIRIQTHQPPIRIPEWVKVKSPV